MVTGFLSRQTFFFGIQKMIFLSTEKRIFLIVTECPTYTPPPPQFGNSEQISETHVDPCQK